MRSLLITGANRGLGLELVKQFLNHSSAKPEILIATARKPSEAKELQELAAKDKSLHILPLDVTKFDTFKEFNERVGQIVGDQGLNVVINNVGILLQREGTLETTTAESLCDHFLTNTVAPVILTQTLLSLVKKAAKLQSGGISINRAGLIYMSAILGSVSGRMDPTYRASVWGYRESKAALNMAARTICSEVAAEGVGVLVLHPGWVKTDMGGPNADLTITESVEGVIKVILGLCDETNGSFLQWNGVKLPW